MTGRFAGKVALVTAGADGIGGATADAFAAGGARVMVADINTALGEAKVESLRSRGCEAAFVHIDATVEDDIERAVRMTVERFGGLHIGANIVGDVHAETAGPDLHLQSLAGWEWTNAVSLRSVFLSIKHELRHMIDHGGGVICNVTSLAGLLFVPESGPAYAAAKAGVVQLTKFVAVQYGDRNVRANCIAPGTTPTAAYFKGGAEAGAMLTEALLKGHAIKRTITPAEQAAAIAWLCSDDAGMVTGQVLPVDGGWSAR